MVFFYGVLSMIKMLLDRSNMTLIECFTDTITETYYHYSLPLIFLAVIIPFVVSLAAKKIDITAVLRMFQSLMFLLLAIGFVITDKITNGLYVSSLITSAIVSVGVAFLPSKIKYCNKNDISQRIKYAVPITFFYIVTVILSIPLTLFFNNISEIPIIPHIAILTLLAGAAIIFIIMAFSGIFLLTYCQFELFYTLLFSITLAGYIQNMFMNGHMLRMDGTKQTWDKMQLCYNVIVWIVIITAVFCIKKLSHRNISKAYGMICVYLGIVQIVSLVYLGISTLVINRTHSYDFDYIVSTKGALELNSKNNVLVFVLDWYDEQILLKILKTDSEFLEPLDGFTHYSNATSLYAFTDMSLPYLTVGGGVFQHRHMVMALCLKTYQIWVIISQYILSKNIYNNNYEIN